MVTNNKNVILGEVISADGKFIQEDSQANYSVRKMHSQSSEQIVRQCAIHENDLTYSPTVDNVNA